MRKAATAGNVGFGAGLSVQNLALTFPAVPVTYRSALTCYGEMNAPYSHQALRKTPKRNLECGFTLIELLVVIALIAILASLLLPVLSRAKAKGQSIACLNNTRQLGLAWLLYADDHGDRLPYNLGGPTRGEVAERTNLNWVNGILSWALNSDNTNRATITEASLGAYASKTADVYRCPSDRVLSATQREAGWSARVRSYSMNAMVGDAGSLSRTGFNQNNPTYIQFFKLSSIPRPQRIFVFLDEHPDSINDGYFLNKSSVREWIDLPASYHNGAASFSFADGHSEFQYWKHSLTKRPPAPDIVALPLGIPDSETTDYYWIMSRMSVGRY